MKQSDFAWVNFDETFSSENKVEHRTFHIDGEPTAAHSPGDARTSEGYIVIQAKNVGLDRTIRDDGQEMRHRVQINGKDLPQFDMVAQNGWSTWMDRIPEGFLKKGDNRLTVRRVDEDLFHVANIVVHWREYA